MRKWRLSTWNRRIEDYNAWDHIRMHIANALEEQKQKLNKCLKRLDIHEQEDIEPLLDSISEQVKQAMLKQKSFDKIEQYYSKKELGLNEAKEVYPLEDKGGDELQINKAIDKVGKKSDKIHGKRKRLARGVIESIAGAGYYGYLLLRRKLSIPLEHPILKPWYAKFLPWIPALVNPGGIVLLREGTYAITSSPILIQKSNIKVAGVGHASILSVQTSINGIEIGKDVSVNNIIIEDLALDGNAYTGNYGILIQAGTSATTKADVDRVVVSKNYINGFYQEGIRGDYAYSQDTTRKNDRALILNNIVEECRPAQGYIHAHYGHFWIVIGNDVFGSDLYSQGIRHGHIIAGNRVVMTTTTYSRAGIMGGGGDRGAIIANNRLVGQLWIESFLGKEVIVGNVSDYTDVAVKLMNGDDYSIVSDNQLEGYIYIDSTYNRVESNRAAYISEDVNADYNIIKTNYFTTPASHSVNGANTIVRSNEGFSTIKTVTASYSATWADEIILVDASGAAVTVTLPPPASYPNVPITIKKIDSSTNVVTINPNATETIDGAASQSLSAQNAFITVVSDGVNWYIVASG